MTSHGTHGKCSHIRYAKGCTSRRRHAYAALAAVGRGEGRYSLPQRGSARQLALYLPSLIPPGLSRSATPKVVEDEHVANPRGDPLIERFIYE